jgi:hypothetical protein
MSVVGQKRRFDRAPITSGLPRKADMFRVRRHVSKVLELGRLFDRRRASHPHRTYGHGKLNVRRALTPPANTSEGANLRATSPARRCLASRLYSNRADDLLRRARIRRRRDDPCRCRRC